MKRFWPKSIFWKNVFILSSGTAIAQLLPVAVSPILSRLFSPAQFGTFGLYFSLTMIFSVLICGRYEFAIMLPSKDQDRINILALALLVAVVVSIILMIPMVIFRTALSELFQNRSIRPYIVWIPFSVLIIGIYQSLNYWANRNKQYKRLAISRVLRSSNTSFLSIVAGSLNLKKSGLIIADFFGQLFATIFLGFSIWKRSKHLIPFITKREIKAAALRYINFPKFHVLSGLLEKCASHAPVLLLTALFTETEAGYFSFALKIISAPIALIAVSIGDVFRQEASELYIQHGQCTEVFKKTFKKLFLIGVIPFTVGIFIIQPLFPLIFGKEWAIAGGYSQIMMMMLFLQFIFSPLSSMFVIAEKQHVDMIINLVLLLCCVLAFVIGKKVYNNAKAAIIIYTVGYSIKYIIEFYLSYQFSKGKHAYAK